MNLVLTKKIKLILILILAVGWIFFPPNYTKAWWNANYLYRKKIYFTNSPSAVNLANFPVMVQLTSSNFDFNKVLTNGEDVRFVDSDDAAALSYEIEYFNKAGQNATIWVKVPQIDASSNSDFIYLYYDYASAVDGQASTSVWTNNYEAVYHFAQTSGNYHDSTGNGHTSDAVSVTSRTNTCLGNCPSFNGTSNYITIPDSAGFDQHDYTITAYIRCDALGVVANTGNLGLWMCPIIAKGTAQAESIAADIQFSLGVTGNLRLAADFENDVNPPNSGGSQNTPVSSVPGTISCNGSTFYSVVDRVDTANDVFQVYWDGALKGASSTTYWPATVADMKVGIGTTENTSGTRAGWWNGLIDEVRIEREARSAEWIYAQASSTANNYLTYDTEEAAGSSADLSQVAYEWFANNNSTAVGSSSFANQAITAPAQGTPFRLRLLLHVSTAQLNLNYGTSTLQYAVRSGSCDTSSSGESYTSISSTTGAIRFYNNSGATDGAALTANARDPRHNADTVKNQVYSEGSNNFTNSQSAIAVGEDGLWDFALVDYSAEPNTAYCFRASQVGGGALSSYSVMPELATRKALKVKLKGRVVLRKVFLR